MTGEKETVFIEDIRSQQQDFLFKFLAAGGISLVLTIGIYFFLSKGVNAEPLQAFFGNVPESGHPRWISVLLSRGLIQPMNICLFLFGITFLLSRVYSAGKEMKFLSMDYFTELQTDSDAKRKAVIDEQTLVVLENRVSAEKKENEGNVPILVKRFQAVIDCLKQDGNASQAHELLSDVAQIDRDRFESEFAPIRYLTWVIPTLGFLGTVLGMGSAITGFADVVSSVSGGSAAIGDNLRPLLNSVAHDLGTAFDTTLLALLLSAVLVAVSSWVQKKEDTLLSNIDEYCVQELLSRVRLPDLTVRTLENGFAGIAQMMQVYLADMSRDETKSQPRDNLTEKLDEMASHLSTIARIATHFKASAESGTKRNKKQSEPR